MSRKVGIKDVAREAGVGLGTTSRVLNNHPSVSEEKREKVLAAVRKLDYRPNQQARSLKTNETRTLGVLVMNFGNPFYSDVLSGIEEEAEKRGYGLLFAQLDGHPDRFDRQVQLMRKQNIDGLLFMGASVDDSMQRGFESIGCPVCLVSTAMLTSDLFTDRVSIDNRGAARQMTRHLIQLGHRKIGLISGLKGDPNTDVARHGGFREALEEASIAENPKWIFSGDHTLSSGYRAAEKMLTMEERPTAIFATSDSMAIGALRAAEDLGLHVPGQLSIAGFDGLEIGSYTVPALTTIDQPRREMGRQGVRLLIERINRSDRPLEEKQLAFELVCRASTAKWVD